MWVQSGGLDKGASFVLELPLSVVISTVQNNNPAQNSRTGSEQQSRTAPPASVVPFRDRGHPSNPVKDYEVEVLEEEYTSTKVGAKKEGEKVLERSGNSLRIDVDSDKEQLSILSRAQKTENEVVFAGSHVLVVEDSPAARKVLIHVIDLLAPIYTHPFMHCMLPSHMFILSTLLLLRYFDRTLNPPYTPYLLSRCW